MSARRAGPALATLLALAIAPGHAAAMATGGLAAAGDDGIRRLGVIDSVVVTASRGAGRIATPGATSVLGARDVLARADPTLDGALRGTPGFALFRRASAAASNPTTQSANFRGLASSGASRVLVLVDGGTLNDPFGSWVAWDRLPIVAVDRVEVLRGPPADLYGPDAVAGLVQVFTPTPDASRLRALVDGGSRDARRLSGLAQGRAGDWAGTLAGEWQRLAGFVTTAPEARGTIDTPASLESANGFAAAEWGHDGVRVRTRVATFDEDRGNGTPGQFNDTRVREARAGVEAPLAGGTGRIDASVGHQRYHQTFTAVTADRDSERLTSEQRIPTSDAAASAAWFRAWRRFGVVGGADAQWVKATIDELRYPAAGAPVASRTDGAQRTASLFGRVCSSIDRVTLAAGMRGTWWDSPRTSAAASPRLSAVLALGGGVSVTAAAYQAWRAPTLNERHRDFRAGNVVTLANPDLAPERYQGVEAGLAWARGPAAARATAYTGRLDHAITNVTLAVTPSSITRVRRNADRIVASGVELEGELRPVAALVLSGYATFTRSRFARTPELPALEGLRVPQVPWFQAGAALAWDTRLASLRVELRSSGRQFDDDRNQLPLAPFTVWDASARRALGGGLSLFIATENAFDRVYDVGRTPFRTIGTPRSVRAGATLVRDSGE